MRLSIFFLLSAILSAPAAVDFSHQIVPILREHCAECHAGDKKKGGFSFNDRKASLQTAKPASSTTANTSLG
jgi:mono/diheme cytochrome c family protein